MIVCRTSSRTSTFCFCVSTFCNCSSQQKNETEQQEITAQNHGHAKNDTSVFITHGTNFCGHLLRMWGCAYLEATKTWFVCFRLRTLGKNPFACLNPDSPKARPIPIIPQYTQKCLNRMHLPNVVYVQNRQTRFNQHCLGNATKLNACVRKTTFKIMKFRCKFKKHNSKRKQTCNMNEDFDWTISISNTFSASKKLPLKYHRILECLIQIR